MIRTARRAALRIFSGRKLYNFGLPERLRTLRQSIFTGGVVKVNGICSACFLRKRRRCGNGKTLSVIAARCQLPRKGELWLR